LQSQHDQQNHNDKANNVQSTADSANIEAYQQQIMQLQRQRTNETEQLRLKVQEIVKMQQGKMLEQAKEFQLNIAAERDHMSKAMLQLTREKSAVQGSLRSVEQVVIPELKKQNRDLLKQVEQLQQKNENISSELDIVRKDYAADQLLWQDYQKTNNFETEKLEFLEMIRKINDLGANIRI